ncbi:PocR ligand-binding domain-containing protein [Gelria sp. Kuro-4]|uniref:PocR ligand-binding domain-containing protein n=1 Tax=Gelria sp. Kuro-4 TaxID=2796927 RepID=UPI001BF124EA|nr:PocR ligand-binding domain-containing protein [Gelria sp. Kuro-4]BCV24870.1 hypothetical protein kuro4_16430 [Gelria sp. Kuro-4]
MTAAALNIKEGKQVFPWGDIEWLHSPGIRGRGSVSLGIVSLLPGSCQEPHNHYADEQILYGIQGSSTHYINEQTYELGPGSWLYLEPYVNHGMSNSSLEEARFLLVANPVSQAAEIGEHDNSVLEGSFTPVRIADLTDQTNLQEVQDKFASVTGLAVSIVGPTGLLLTEPAAPPAFCRLCILHHGQCEFLVEKHREACTENELELLKCSYGVVAVRMPVQVHGAPVMSIVCGYVLLDKPGQLETERVFKLAKCGGYPQEEVLQFYKRIELVTRNRLISAAELLRVTAFSLSRIFVTAAKERELKDYRWRFLKEQNDRVMLEADLQRTRLALIESQINPHFLFNTLNLIAESSVMRGDEDISELVYALCGLLRFSLKQVGHLVKLKDELQYVKNYLCIQEHRFPGSFIVSINVSDELQECKVPAMILQPLVENFFVHALTMNREIKCTLKITGSADNSIARIAVEDDGRGIPPERLAEVQSWLKSDPCEMPPGSGIRGVFWRLQRYFNGKGSLEIRSVLGHGTTVSIMLPWVR